MIVLCLTMFYVKQMKKDSLLDVNVLRGAAEGIPDHYVVNEKQRVEKGGNKKKTEN